MSHQTRASKLIKQFNEADFDPKDLNLLHSRMTGSETDLGSHIERGNKYQFVKPYGGLPAGTTVKILSMHTSLGANQYSVTVEVLDDSNVATVKTIPVRDFMAHTVSVNEGLADSFKKKTTGTTQKDLDKGRLDQLSKEKIKKKDDEEGKWTGSKTDKVGQ